MAARAATRPEILAALRRADAAKDSVAAARLKKLYDATPEAPVEEEYRLEGYTPQVMQDVQSIASDAMTRGFGPGNADAARERQPGWIETPADILGSVVGSPYKVGSKLAGMAYGAGEGALSEYGHQENWIPGVDELKDIGAAGVEGAGLGWLGAKVGEWFGGSRAAKDAVADQPYPTDASLRTAADEAERLAPGGPRSADLQDRVSRVGDVRTAASKGRDEFAHLRSGSPEEAAEFAKIAQKKALSPFAADQIERLSIAKGGNVDIGRLARLALDLKTTGGMGTAGATAADLLGVPARLRSVPAREAERAAALVRDPRGIGLTPDPATIDKWRSGASKLFSGYGGAP